jgi:hypothetical protein
MTETSYAEPPAAGPPGEPLRIAVFAAGVRDHRMGRTLAGRAAFRAAAAPRTEADLSPAGYTAPADVTEAFDGTLHELTWWATLLRAARSERPRAR